MKKSILTIIFCMAGSAAICWLCDWKMKAIVWMLLFWAVERYRDKALALLHTELKDYLPLFLFLFAVK